MARLPASFTLPHLSPDELSDRDHEESRLSKQLSACWRGDDFDIERAYQVMRGSAERIFDVLYVAYGKKSGYRHRWLPEIVKDAVYRTLKVSQAIVSYGIPAPSISQLGDGLEATVRDHLKELKRAQLRTETPDASALADGAQTVNSSERLALRDAYRAAFPDVKIADIIWAAKQTRREWTRWISGEAKDGLKPDRAFRHVLTSGKKPEEIVGKPRPIKYSA